MIYLQASLKKASLLDPRNFKLSLIFSDIKNVQVEYYTFSLSRNSCFIEAGWTLRPTLSQVPIIWTDIFYDWFAENLLGGF